MNTTSNNQHIDTSPAEVQELLDRYQKGHALPREFYDSTTMYERDLDHVWGRNWIWVGHASQVPAKGDYFVFEFGRESVIVVRDGEGDVRAHLNVCRHRGSRVCIQAAGRTQSFTCPYHAWTYGLDGSLRTGRLMPEGFKREDHGLRPVALLNFQELLFICIGDNPPPLPENIHALTPMTAPFGFEQLKIAHSEIYPVSANWKLGLENYLECYHCAPSHVEYSKSHSLKDPDSMTQELIAALETESTKTGLPTGEHYWPGDDTRGLGTDVYYRRYPLYPGYQTGSKSGKPLAPLLGSLDRFDGGATDITIAPLNHFLAYSDHLVGYRFVPRDVQQTDIHVVWMVRNDAEEGRDYTLDDLTWLWKVTTLDDERIIRHNQAGVNSRHFVPGPLSTMEWGIDEFYGNYLRMIG